MRRIGGIAVLIGLTVVTTSVSCGSDSNKGSGGPSTASGGAGGSGGTGTGGAGGGGGTSSTGGGAAGSGGVGGSGGTSSSDGGSGGSGTGGAPAGGTGGAAGATDGPTSDAGGAGGTPDEGEGGAGGELSEEESCLAQTELDNACAQCACQNEECRSALLDCTEATDVAEAGPAAGTSRGDLCLGLLQCTTSSGCGATFGQNHCLCGDLSQEACGESQPGPCEDEIKAAGETEDPGLLALRTQNTGFALGRAAVISNCLVTNCAEQCL